MRTWGKGGRAALMGGVALLLAGCGGGGGGVNSSGSTPTTSSGGSSGGGTATTPTPTVINYDDAEYRRSNAAVDAGAISAWNAGATGAGITLAVIDSGLTDTLGEFAGRISSASASVAGNGSYADEDGHGTAVAAVAAAGRNGSDVEGVAFGATVLAIRADSPGTCAATDGCSFLDSNLASGLDYARTHGAKVVNLSLGGDDGASPQFLAALNRATAAGLIVVVASGNDSAAMPDAFARAAVGADGSGLVIIAGAHDSTGAASSFSNKAGSYGQNYLSALGTAVRAFDNKGADYLWSGTSFATPEIAAAAALLEQAFPNLTPAQVVALLYSSATDAGTAGVDSDFGHGLLNLAKAFEPAGTTTLAGSQVAVAAADGSILSAAMGDATLATAALGRAIVLDSYGRAFRYDLSGAAARVTATRPLGASIAGGIRTTSSSTAGFAVSTSIATARWASDAYSNHGANPLVQPLVAAQARRSWGGGLSTAFGFAASGQALSTSLDPDDAGPSFIAARAPGEDPGFTGRRATAMAVRQAMGRIAISASAEHGTVAWLSAADPVTSGYTLAAMRAERRWGALTLGVGGGSMREDGTLLGARLAPAFGSGGATTRFVDATARLTLGGGWSARAAVRQGWTAADGGGLLTAADLRSRSASLDLQHLGRESRIGLRLAQPTRVTAGGLTLSVPTAYDYGTGAVTYTADRLSLAPHGRETDAEASWGRRVAGGWLDANLFWRRQPGNVALAPDDRGTALRYSWGF